MDPPHTPSRQNHNHQTACASWRDALFDVALEAKSRVTGNLMEIRPGAQAMCSGYRSQFCRCTRTRDKRVSSKPAHSAQEICISSGSFSSRQPSCRSSVQEEARCARCTLYVHII
jgi:hypothetical protein